MGAWPMEMVWLASGVGTFLIILGLAGVLFFQHKNRKLRDSLLRRGVELENERQLRDQVGDRLKEALEQRASLLSAVEERDRRLLKESERRSAMEEKAGRIPGLEKKNEDLIRETLELKETLARLKTRLADEQRASREKMELINDARQKLSDAFKGLSSEALQSNNKSFLELAKVSLEKFQDGARGDLESRKQSIDRLIKPIGESLARVDTKLGELEKARISAYSSITEQVKNLAMSQKELKGETARLVRALRTPTVRGRWGEIQLRRVVEIAGMLPYCDFVEQESVLTDKGKLRPDLIVRLPGGKNVVVDAKAPLEAYLNAVESEDEHKRQTYLDHHARQIRDHMAKLSSKGYWEQFEPTPEFLVMFLPGETFFGAALEQNPALIEEGVTQRVIPSSPTTLIALLRAVAYGWRQEKVAQSAQEVSKLGRELYERIRVFSGHLDKVGSGLCSAVESYNKAVGSFESRVLVTARRFPDLGTGASRTLDHLQGVERSPRTVTATDCQSDPGDRGAGEMLQGSGQEPS